LGGQRHNNKHNNKPNIRDHSVGKWVHKYKQRFTDLFGNVHKVASKMLAVAEVALSGEIHWSLLHTSCYSYVHSDLKSFAGKMTREFSVSKPRMG